MVRKLFGTDGVRGKANLHPMTAEMALRIVAGSISETLTFTSTTTGCCHGPALDNVRIVEVIPPATVPLPASGALGGVALAALMAWRRRK